MMVGKGGWACVRLAAWVVVVGALVVGCGDDPAKQTPTANNGDAVLCSSDFDCSAGLFCVDAGCRAEGTECFTDPDCTEAGEVCVHGWCAPRAVECVEDAGCEDGNICTDGACVDGCRTDAQCDGNRVCDMDRAVCVVPTPMCPDPCPDHTACNTSNGQCQPDGTCTSATHCRNGQVCEAGQCADPVLTCSVNSDCQDGSYCDRTTSECVEGCRLSNECRGEEVCVAGTCTTPPECDADANEPNDEANTATAITSGTTFEGLTICQEEDWFSFRAFAGDEVDIMLTFVHDEGDLNLQLVDPEGNVLQLSASTNDDEVIQRSVNATGQHWLRVFSPNRGAYTHYDLSFSRTRNCAADDSEENDAADAPTPLQGTSVTLLNRTICEADDDWYAVPLFAGEQLRASIDFSHVEGDLSLELTNAAGDAVLASSATETDLEEVTWDATGVELVLLHVPGAADLINAYDLTVEVTPRACEDDAGEQDDERATARSLALGAATSGQICAGDEDWFVLTTPADATLTVSLTHQITDGDLNIQAFQADGTTLIASAESMDDNESFDFAAPLPGEVTFRVIGAGRSQAAYTLTVTSDFDVVCPADDAFEENDAFDATALLTPGVHSNLVMCEGDDVDWYSFEVAEGQSFQFFALAAEAFGTLAVDLYGPDAADATATPVETVDGVRAVKRLQQQVGAAAGTWRVRVRREAGAAVLYSVRVFVYDGRLPLECPDDDGFEDNDDAASATPLAVDTTLEAIVCGADSDWYRVPVVAGELMSLRADFVNAVGNLDLKLYDSALNLIDETEDMTDNAWLNVLAPAWGSMFIEVVLTGGEGNVYGLTASRIAGPETIDCATDDSYEQNDTFATASAVQPGVIAATLCGVDEDHYAIPVAAGQTVRATLLHNADPDVLGLALRDSTDLEVVAAPSTGDSSRRLRYDAVVGEQLVLVVTASAAVQARYGLNIEVFDAGLPVCGTPDALEPNTEPNDAVVVDAAMEWTNLGLCGGDQDWFEVVVADGMQAVFEARFDAAAGDLDLDVFDQVGDGVASSHGTSGVERVVLPADGDSVFRVVAWQPDAAAAASDLRYDVSLTYEETRAPCIVDAFEPNEDQTSASPVLPGVYEAGFCAGEADWYLVTLAPLGILTVSITFDGTEADLDLELIDLFPAVSDGTGDYEEVGTISFFGGPVPFRVYSPNPDEGTGYTLSVTIETF